MMDFQLPLSGSLGITSFPAKLGYYITDTFNSLSRDHTDGVEPLRELSAAFNSLSRDHALKSEFREVADRISDTFNSLSRDHCQIAHNALLSDCKPFNSLSRDH